MFGSCTVIFIINSSVYKKRKLQKTAQSNNRVYSSLSLKSKTTRNRKFKLFIKEVATKSMMINLTGGNIFNLLI